MYIDINPVADGIRSALGGARRGFEVDGPAASCLQKIQQEVEEEILKKAHNARPVRTKAVFSDTPLGGTDDSRIQEIIEGISTLGLPLRIFSGEAHWHVWSGRNLKTKEQFTPPIWLIRNETLGHELEIRLEPIGDKPHYEYGHVKGLLYRVDPSRQGFFWDSRQFIREQIGKLFLEHLGYNSIYGDAMWSLNTVEKGNPGNDKMQSWRWLPRFAGWDSLLNPIYLSGLTLFYYRLGFVADLKELDAVMQGVLPSCRQRKVVLYSNAGKQRMREWLGKEAWADLTKYSVENRREWAVIQKARKGQLPLEEQEKRKAEVYAQLIKRQIITDDLIE